MATALAACTLAPGARSVCCALLRAARYLQLDAHADLATGSVPHALQHHCTGQLHHDSQGGILNILIYLHISANVLFYLIMISEPFKQAAVSRVGTFNPILGPARLVGCTMTVYVRQVFVCQ